MNHAIRIKKGAKYDFDFVLKPLILFLKLEMIDMFIVMIAICIIDHAYKSFVFSSFFFH